MEDRCSDAAAASDMVWEEWPNGPCTIPAKFWNPSDGIAWTAIKGRSRAGLRSRWFRLRPKRADGLAGCAGLMTHRPPMCNRTSEDAPPELGFTPSSALSLSKSATADLDAQAG